VSSLVMDAIFLFGHKVPLPAGAASCLYIQGLTLCSIVVAREENQME
jgi:hypothetical protein